MTVWFWAALAAWLLLWMVLIARGTAAREPRDQVKVLGATLPPFTAVTLFLLFALITKRGKIFTVVLWLHHAAFFSLFAFLTAGQFLQIQTWWQIRQERSSQDVAATVRRLWALAEIAPAPIALTVFLTGLRLVWEKPATNNPSALWLFALIVSFSVFFFDGILGYQPIVRKMLEHWSQAARQNVPASRAARNWNGTSDCIQLLLHFLSWPFVFALGLLRPRSPNPFGSIVAGFQNRVSFFPAGWPEVATAVVLWAVIGTFVLLARTYLRLRLPQGNKADAVGSVGVQ